MDIHKFQTIVWNYYKLHGRTELPWRKTKDPYKILVSEVMLQQTQVERVIPYYTDWIRRFPNVEALAAAPLADVLRAWHGLGYNRRAKMLYDAAKLVMKEYGGKLPKTVEELDALPGVGPYTARAVKAFSANESEVFIETNLRTVVTHHFFADREDVTDTEVLAVLTRALPRATRSTREHKGAREWYWALMDYGSFLKRSGVRINAKSKHYAKQSQFKGSAREACSYILKALAKGERSGAFLIEILGPDRRTQLRSQIASLTKEGMIELVDGRFRLPH